MLPTPNNSAEFIIFVYLYFCEIWKKIKTKLLPKEEAGRKSTLTVPDLLTLGCMFVFSGIPTIKRFYEFALFTWQDWFAFPKYQNFIAGMNKAVGLASICLQHLLKLFRLEYKAHALDSSALPVCRVKREYANKVCRGIAKKGYSTMGWFFGFKLHIVVSQEGYLLSVVITKGNVDDRFPVEKLVQDLKNCLIVVDAGYISQELQRTLLKKGIHLFYATKKNMKKLMTVLQHCLLKSRQIVETVFSILKERMPMVSSLPRSVLGHFARYIFTLLGYQLKCLVKTVNLIS
jgi:hypothetical protein